MKLQIVGPMSGLPDDNVPAFLAAERRLVEAGHDVVNPVDFATDDDRRMAVELGADFKKTANYRRLIWMCLESIRGQDGLATLEGWQRSEGASAEIAFARTQGKLIQPVHVWEAEEQPVLRWTGDPECAPTKGYPDDAGFDLYVSEDVHVPVDGFRDVPLGISVELPPGRWAMLTGRSSTIRRRRILVTQGIIDNGYRGPLYAGCQNVGEDVCQLLRGERIAQLILFPIEAPSLQQVAELAQSDRGSNGFGSTGQ